MAHIFECFPKERVKISSTYIARWRLPLAQYSPVSRAWKASIERLTFRELIIKTDELDAFASLFRWENISRRATLASPAIVFILPPPHNPADCCAVVRTPDRGADSAAFSVSVAKIFTILADLEALASETPPLSLKFHTAYRSSNFQEPSGSKAEPCMILDRQYQHM
jgi:hypothetical protein